MKLTVHKSSTRGSADHGWLKANHSFSFASYYDPDRVHFGMLRVLNDDTIAPGMGFGTHPHDNMEIVTIPLKGTLAHKDSMGHTSVIKPGEVQIMSAGTGITHSEFNNSKTEELKLLQIWVFPNEKNITPRYDQKYFEDELKENKFLTVLSPDKSDDSMWINQDAWFSLGKFKKDKQVEYSLHKNDSGVYLFVIDGKIKMENNVLENRDAVAVKEAEKFTLVALEDSELLMIEVPMR